MSNTGIFCNADNPRLLDLGRGRARRQDAEDRQRPKKRVVLAYSAASTVAAARAVPVCVVRPSVRVHDKSSE